MSSWPIATSAPYTIEISASVITTGVAQLRGVGEQPEAEPQHPEGADLVEDADQQHAGAGGVACSVVSASQVCTGNSGALTAKAMKKPTNSHFRVSGRCRGCCRSQSRYDGRAGVRRTTTYRPITDAEHHQAAGELVDQELQPRPRGASPPKPPIRKYAGISVASNTT